MEPVGKLGKSGFAPEAPEVKRNVWEATEAQDGSHGCWNLMPQVPENRDSLFVPQYPNL